MFFFLICIGIGKVAIEIAPDFRPGAIGELCTEDAGAEKRIIFIETSGYKCLKPRQVGKKKSIFTSASNIFIFILTLCKGVRD